MHMYLLVLSLCLISFHFCLVVKGMNLCVAQLEILSVSLLSNTMEFDLFVILACILLYSKSPMFSYTE